MLKETIFMVGSPGKTAMLADQDDGGQCGRYLVAAAEPREAAFGCEAVVKPAIVFLQVKTRQPDYDRFAAERSLAQLGSCYDTLWERVG
jgi:hypothetical protein